MMQLTKVAYNMIKCNSQTDFHHGCIYSPAIEISDGIVDGFLVRILVT